MLVYSVRFFFFKKAGSCEGDDWLVPTCLWQMWSHNGVISITLNAVSEACSVSAFIRARIHGGCRGEKSSVTRKERVVTSQDVFCINFTVEVPPFKWLHQCNATWGEQKVSTLLIRFPHSRFYLRNRACYLRALTRCGVAGAVDTVKCVTLAKTSRENLLKQPFDSIYSVKMIPYMICCHELKCCEKKIASYLSGCWWWCKSVGDIILARIGTSSINRALLKRHSLPEYCCWPCPSFVHPSNPRPI